jgi:hypothetical protein
VQYTVDVAIDDLHDGDGIVVASDHLGAKRSGPDPGQSAVVLSGPVDVELAV